MARIWSVELEATEWADDTFNGTYDECVEYCEKNGYKVDGEEARLVENEFDEDGCVTYTYKIVTEL